MVEIVHDSEPSQAIMEVESWYVDFKERVGIWGPPIMIACVGVWHNGGEGDASGHAVTAIKYSGTGAIPVTMIPVFAAEHLRLQITKEMVGPGYENKMQNPDENC